jgi:hypothetical protein
VSGCVRDMSDGECRTMYSGVADACWLLTAIKGRSVVEGGSQRQRRTEIVSYAPTVSSMFPCSLALLLCKWILQI